jgi:flagellar motor switch protein FliM
MTSRSPRHDRRSRIAGDGRSASIQPFDFKRPSTLSREHIRMMQMAQDNLARGLTTMFAGSLRAVATVTALDLEQRTYDEYIRSVPNPALLTMLGFGGRIGCMVEIPLPVAFAATELLLGGPGGKDQPARAMTDLELALMRNIVDQMIPEFRTAVEPIMAIEPEFAGQESNPQFAQFAGPSEMVILVSFEVKLEHATGVIRFCLPFAHMQPHLDALSHTAQSGDSDGELEERRRVQQHLSASPVQVSAAFRPAIASSRQIVELAVGDVIMTNHPTSLPLTMHVQGVPVYDATLGRVGRQLALQIQTEVPVARVTRRTRLTVTEPATRTH